MNVHCIRNMIAERTVTAWSGTTPTAWNDIWLHYDLLGNVVGWHGPSGEFTRADRDAYGRPLPGTIAAQTPSGYGLTTKPRDPATGLVYFGARWYDPDNGRWNNTDPQYATNDYMFCSNMPTSRLDADGQRDWPWPANGTCSNGGPGPVDVWDMDHGLVFQLPPFTRTPYGADFDQWRYPNDPWRKIGPHDVIVRDGNLPGDISPWQNNPAPQVTPANLPPYPPPPPRPSGPRVADDRVTQCTLTLF